MWPSLITVFGLFALCAGYSNVPSDPANKVESILDSVNLNIQRLLERQRSREESISQLFDTSSDNQALQYEFFEVALEDVSNEISIQNQRLKRLGQAIAQVRGLKTEVGKLRAQAKSIEDLVNKTDATDIYTLDGLNDLAENDFQEGQQINETVTEASRLQQSLESTNKILVEYHFTLAALEFRTAQLITTVDYISVKAFERNLTLKNGLAEANIRFPGFVKNVGAYVTGFDLTHNGSKYKSDATASLAFDVKASFGTDLIEVDAYDLSSKGWYTNSLSASVIGTTYFDRRLNIRYPFQNPQ